MTTPHPAGVQAHGLHAIAHHIAVYRLPTLRVELDKDGLTVQCSGLDVAEWLETVAVDETTTKPARDWPGMQVEERKVRLRDSGVVVTLVAFAPILEAVSA